MCFCGACIARKTYIEICFFRQGVWPMFGDSARVAQLGSQAARKWRENETLKRKWRESEEMERKWRENEEIERLIYSFFLPSLFISNIKNRHILSQNVRRHYCCECYKKLTYALWENNSGSNSLPESSASCTGLGSPTSSFPTSSFPTSMSTYF